MKIFISILCLLELLILIYFAVTGDYISLIKNVCILIGSFICGIIYGNLKGDKDEWR